MEQTAVNTDNKTRNIYAPLFCKWVVKTIRLDLDSVLKAVYGSRGGRTYRELRNHITMCIVNRNIDGRSIETFDHPTMPNIPISTRQYIADGYRGVMKKHEILAMNQAPRTGRFRSSRFHVNVPFDIRCKVDGRPHAHIFYSISDMFGDYGLSTKEQDVYNALAYKSLGEHVRSDIRTGGLFEESTVQDPEFVAWHFQGMLSDLYETPFSEMEKLYPLIQSTSDQIDTLLKKIDEMSP
jgi:hypothetical protein